MFRKMVLAALVVALGATTLAQEAGAQRRQPRARVRSTVDILNTRMPEVTFQDTPLEQVMDWLADFTQLNVSVRWQTLADAGVERDTPISIQARNLRLSQVLWLIMNEAGGTDLKLAYRASGSLLILSTEDDLSREMITKIYDVSDLLVRIPRASRQSAFNVTQGMGQGGGSGGGGGGMFQQGQQQQQQDDYNRGGAGGQGTDPQMEQLVELIIQTVEPDSWRNNGGLGTIMPFQRTLVVRNTLLVHQRLGGYVTEDELLSK